VHGGIVQAPAGERLWIGAGVKNLDIVGVIEAAILAAIGIDLR
jgi:hypothetical protein